MGHRLEVYTDETTAQELIRIAKGFHLDAQVIGRVEASDATRLTISGAHGTFEYAKDGDKK
jgi:phosphoribosylformylglycinamidine cyclo-ligase